MAKEHRYLQQIVQASGKDWELKTTGQRRVENSRIDSNRKEQGKLGSTTVEKSDKDRAEYTN